MEGYDPETDQIHVVLGLQDLERRKVQREVLQTSAFVPAFPVSHLLVISYDVRAKHSARPAHLPSDLSILLRLLTT